MEIEEIRKRKILLEDNIIALLKDFYITTGVAIKDLSCRAEFSEGFGMRREPYHHRIQTELDL